DGGVQQRTDFGQFVDDGRVGFPDELAAEELQRRYVNAVALNRIDDVIVDHAIFLAGHEVVYAVGRRGVNHAGAGAQFNVVGQVNRRQAIVERVTEVDQFQFFTGGGRNDRTFQAVAGQARLDQLFSQQQQLVADVDQGVVEFRVNVKRLVDRKSTRLNSSHVKIS